MQPGIRRGDDERRRPGRGRSAVDLAVADAAGEVGLGHRVRAARAAAQTVVVGLDERRTRGASTVAHRAVRLLHVAEVARVLHDDRDARWPERGRGLARPAIRRSRGRAR